MEVVILQKNEEILWDAFVKNHLLGSVHQMSDWGRFQSTLKSRDKYFIVVIKEKNHIIGGSLIIKHRLPKGFSWLYAPRGPLLDYSNPEVNVQLKIITNLLKSIAKEYKSLFLRIDPAISCYPVKINGFFNSKNGYQPQYTLTLDLKQSEAELLAQMKQKGRYNIKLATKKGVKVHFTDVKKSDNYIKDISDFYSLLSETTNRDGFRGHDKNFYKSMIDILSINNHSKLFIATLDGKPLAGLIATFSNDTVTYYYGASSNKNRNVMAPYLLQWEAIKYAKKHGFKKYDFLGIAPDGAKNHAWSGVTSFKRKFGGDYITYANVLEKPFSLPLYLIYRFYKFLRK